MMGLLASLVKQYGGKAIGVINKHLLDKIKPLEALDKIYIVDSMQERKKMFQSLADAFIVMPGELGTLEKAIETWNAIKLGELDKKIGFLNIDYFFNKLFVFIDHCKDHEFILLKDSNIPIVHSDANQLLKALIAIE